jgi:hypothetical protein
LEPRKDLSSQLNVGNRLRWCSCLPERRKSLDEIRPAHDADDFSVLNNRHSLDPMTFEQRRDIGNGGVRLR